MEGRTHRVGGALCTLLGYSILEARGMLSTEVSPLLQLTLVYPFALYGSVFSDLDHSWQSAPAKDAFSFVVNKVLHLTTRIRKQTRAKGKLLGVFDARHRSWQTHSVAFLLLLLLISWVVLSGNLPGSDGVILELVATGFIFGVVSHLFLDMLTPDGIWLISLSLIRGKRVTLSLVPRSKFFSTGGSWESIVRFVMYVAIVFLTVRLLYILSPYRFEFAF